MSRGERREDDDRECQQTDQHLLHWQVFRRDLLVGIMSIRRLLPSHAGRKA
jgi:hypothetical protein